MHTSLPEGRVGGLFPPGWGEAPSVAVEFDATSCATESRYVASPHPNPSPPGRGDCCPKLCAHPALVSSKVSLRLDADPLRNLHEQFHLVGHALAQHVAEHEFVFASSPSPLWEGNRKRFVVERPITPA